MRPNLTHEQQALIDAYMDLHHPRTYPLRKARWQTQATHTEIMDETGCSDRLDCGCVRCENVRDHIRPQGFGNASPFRRAA